MKATKTALLAFVLVVVGACLASPASAQQNQPSAETAGQPAVTRKIGPIKTINGNTIILEPDSGSAITVTVQEATRIVRIAPGEKTLKDATPLHLQELQVGDTIR